MFTRSQLIIFSAIGGVVLVSILIFTGVLPGLRKAPILAKPVTIEFWGVFDTPETYEPLFTAYKAAAPHVTIHYTQKSPLTYEQDLLNALANGTGPDVFMLHNRWLPRWQDKIAPLPPTFYTKEQFEQTFADVAAFDLVRDDKVWALPFSIDTLGLFFNRDLFNNARLVEPPKTWEEFFGAIRALTQKDAFGAITRAGAALGSATNVNRASDILALLILQSGSPITDPQTGKAVFENGLQFGGEYIVPGKRALEFLTDFANPEKSVYTWNESQHHSLDAFLEGRAAMMINYGYQIPVIKNRAPHLRFAVALAPQPQNRDLDVAFTSYWPYTVAKSSRLSQEGWRFLAFATQKDVLAGFLKATNRPSARRDLLPGQFSDPEIGPFANQVLVAKSYRAVDNLLVEKVFDDMIEQVVRKEKTTQQAVTEAAARINAKTK